MAFKQQPIVYHSQYLAHNPARRNARERLNKQIYVYVYTNICIYVYTCIYTYVHIYIYIYTSSSGGNQVDGLPPVLTLDCFWAPHLLITKQFSKHNPSNDWILNEKCVSLRLLFICREFIFRNYRGKCTSKR